MENTNCWSLNDLLTVFSSFCAAEQMKMRRTIWNYGKMHIPANTQFLSLLEKIRPILLFSTKIEFTKKYSCAIQPEHCNNNAARDKIYHAQ